MKGKEMRDIETITDSNRQASAIYAAKNRSPMPVWQDDLSSHRIVKSLVKAIPYVDKPDGFSLVGVISTNDDVEGALVANGGGKYYGRIAPDAIGVFVKEGVVPVFPTRL
jgi:hypothetical protein